MFPSPTIPTVAAHPAPPCGLAFLQIGLQWVKRLFYRCLVEIMQNKGFFGEWKLCKTSGDSILLSLKMQPAEVCSRLFIYNSTFIYHDK